MNHYATALRGSDLSQRRAAIQALCQLGVNAPLSSLDLLAPLLRDVDPIVRDGSAEVLLNISKGPGILFAMEHLREMLQDDRHPVRLRALRIIGRVGPRAKSLVPDLIQVLESGDAITARMTAEALSLIGPDSIVALKAASLNPRPIVAREAAWALENLCLPESPPE
jgi:HEAT repeat protein